jgi:hypothetical protein
MEDHEVRSQDHEVTSHDHEVTTNGLEQCESEEARIAS